MEALFCQGLGVSAEISLSGSLHLLGCLSPCHAINCVTEGEAKG